MNRPAHVTPHKVNGIEARTTLARALDQAKIGKLMFFGGNLVRQPAFVQLKADTFGAGFRAIGDPAGPDRVMNESLSVGTYPGLTGPMLSHIIATIRQTAA
jgi:CDP-6-deoxy-D-xylo-4-hexulose-3-dehydrase